MANPKTPLSAPRKLLLATLPLAIYATWNYQPVLEARSEPFLDDWFQVAAVTIADLNEKAERGNDAFNRVFQVIAGQSAPMRDAILAQLEAAWAADQAEAG